jgi:hypothetical protein
LQDVVIEVEDEIRLKIVGTRVDASGIVSYSGPTMTMRSNSFYIIEKILYSE